MEDRKIDRRSDESKIGGSGVSMPRYPDISIHLRFSIFDLR